LTFTDGLKEWGVIYKDIKRYFRNLWGWSETEVSLIKHERLIEIYEEAKEDEKNNGGQVSKILSLLGLK